MILKDVLEIPESKIKRLQELLIKNEGGYIPPSMIMRELGLDWEEATDVLLKLEVNRNVRSRFVKYCSRYKKLLADEIYDDIRDIKEINCDDCRFNCSRADKISVVFIVENQFFRGQL